MKNNLILGVQGLKKMLTGIFFAIVLCGMSVMQAREGQISGAGQQVAAQQARRGARIPQRTQRRVPTARGKTQVKTPQQVRQPIAPQVIAGRKSMVEESTKAGALLGLPLSRQKSEDWVNWFFRQPLPGNDEFQDEVNMVLMVPTFLNAAQKREVTTRIEDFNKSSQSKPLEELRKKYELSQKQVEDLKKGKAALQAMESAEDIVISQAENKGWLASWADYFGINTPERIAAASAVGGVATTAAAGLSAWVWGPAMALVGGAASLMGLAGLTASVSQIRFSWKTGKLTLDQAINARANIIRNQLNGNATYPTSDAKMDALKGLELADLEEQTTDPIFDGARVKIMKEIKEDIAKNPFNKVREALINNEIRRLRDVFSHETLERYMANLEEEAGDIYASEQSMAKWQAFVSEYARAKNKIARGLANKVQNDLRLKEAEKAAAEAQAKYENAKETAVQLGTAAKGAAVSAGSAAVEKGKGWFSNWWNKPAAPATTSAPALSAEDIELFTGPTLLPPQQPAGQVPPVAPVRTQSVTGGLTRIPKQNIYPSLQEQQRAPATLAPVETVEAQPVVTSPAPQQQQTQRGVGLVKKVRGAISEAGKKASGAWGGGY